MASLELIFFDKSFIRDTRGLRMFGRFKALRTLEVINLLHTKISMRLIEVREMKIERERENVKYNVFKIQCIVYESLFHAYRVTF